MGTTSADWLDERLRAAVLGLPGELQSELPRASLAILATYVDRMLEWGARINLTGARDPETLVDQHLVDALPVLSQLPVEPFDAIDVGSGAGLPGAVLAALRPDSRWTLLEPNQKKTAFLSQVRRDFAAAGNGALTIRRGRIEELEPRDVFDVVISRAVWDAGEWLQRGRGLVRTGGVLLGLRSDDGESPTEGARVFRYCCAGRQRVLLRLDL